MACINSTVRGSKDPDETEESGGEELMMGSSSIRQWHEKTGSVTSYDGETHVSEHRLAHGESKTVVDAFGEVRALLWREEWMKAQIELLSQQRDAVGRALEKLMAEKAPVLLAVPPTKKRKTDVAAQPAAGLPNGVQGGTSLSGTVVVDASEASGVTADGDQNCNAWGCMRAVDWQQILGGRRRPLVRAVLPLSSLPSDSSALADSKKRRRASAAHFQLNRNRYPHEESDTVRLEGKKGHHGHHHKHSAHSSHHHHHPGSNRKNHPHASNADAVKIGSVTNGGRRLVTPGGQKVLIKFSATKPSPSPAGRGGSAHAPSSPQVGPRGGKHGGIGTPRGYVDSAPNTPVLSAQKKHKSVLSLVTAAKSSPRMSPANPSTPRGADWGIDDYVYGGPRTHAKIEIVKAKYIETPKWHVIRREGANKPSKNNKESGGGGRLSRSLQVGSKYAKAKPAQNQHQNGSSSNGKVAMANGADVSSEEDTDDETYIARHRPYEEQETLFRFPKQREREEKHREALKKEGGFISSSDAEQAYKSLWYRGDSSNSLDLEAGKGRNG
eukprot:CAMPEP_0181309226 /NCGR_PEP_ID=MMETSP1101-20121128/11900_1 /TAXON_ID=46948 /ORGANISM="Rhodomonas abbreviata, Strain Caron Lab Isolate" /LENGTH=553 /DNA_ID=CAMNT_0023415695 /DNA_START=167 /DNA_END=1825 /DNA_ORIENTATION=+